MDRVLPFNAVEVCRLSRLTLAETIVGIEIFFRTGGGAWSYEAIRQLVLPLLNGLPVGAAQEKCERIRNRTGRASNSEVLSLLLQLLSDRQYQSFPLTRRRLMIRRDLGFWVSPRGYYVKGGVPYIAWTQPRRNFGCDDTPLSMYAAMLSDRFIRNTDFENAQIDFFDFGTLGGQVRVPRRLSFAELPAMKREELQHRLEIFAQAYDDVAGRGIEKESRARREQVVSQGHLFD